MKIYIVFGDTPRSDGKNIEGIFATREAAEKYKTSLEEFRDDTYYNIEEHIVDND